MGCIISCEAGRSNQTSVVPLETCGYCTRHCCGCHTGVNREAVVLLDKNTHDVYISELILISCEKCTVCNVGVTRTE